MPQSLSSHFKQTLIEDRIVRSDIKGPISLPLVLDIENPAQAFALKVKGKQPYWASILVFHHSCRNQADTADNIYAMMDRFKANGTLATVSAVVIGPDVDGHGEVENSIAAMHAGAGTVFAAFETYEDALSWSRIELTKLDTAQHVHG